MKIQVVVFLLFYVANEVMSEDCPFKGLQYEEHEKGNIIHYHTNVDSWQNCSVLCWINEGCYAWTYQTEENDIRDMRYVCALQDYSYNERKYWKSHVYVISGLKACAAERCSGKSDGCCYSTIQHGTKGTPCNIGEGICDNDQQCAGSLTCGNCPWDEYIYCCMKGCTQTHCTKGSLLSLGSKLISASGQYVLAMQHDGNLVLYCENKRIWDTKTSNTAIYNGLYLQPDGNVVLYRTSGQVVWASGTGGKGVKKLMLQDNGNLVLYGQEKGVTPSEVFWSTQTRGVCDAKTAAAPKTSTAKTAAAPKTSTAKTAAASKTSTGYLYECLDGYDCSDRISNVEITSAQEGINECNNNLQCTGYVYYHGGPYYTDASLCKQTQYPGSSKLSWYKLCKKLGKEDEVLDESSRIAKMINDLIDLVDKKE